MNDKFQSRWDGCTGLVNGHAFEACRQGRPERAALAAEACVQGLKAGSTYGSYRHG